MNLPESRKIPLQQNPLFQRVITEHRFELITEENAESFIKQNGLTMLLFIDDPERMKETADALVITPELAYRHPKIKQKGVVIQPFARKLAITYGFRRWPAVVFLKDGGYLGAVDGLRAWGELISETERVLKSTVHYPPSVGIEVRGA